MNEKEQWMNGFRSGMIKLATLVSAELGIDMPPSKWDAADQAIAEI